MEGIEHILKLAAVPKLGPRTFRVLMERFGTAERTLSAGRNELLEVNGVGPAVADGIALARDYDPKPEMDQAARLGVHIYSQADPRYPKGLLQIYDPPILLYVKGDLRPTDTVAMAVVGTRRPSHYARLQADRFSGLLARTGFTIVSGLARGVDSVAHRGALTARGRTIAVLGSGLAHIYPEENRDLAAEISNAGAVISEFPLDRGPSRENFPRRNRLIAGLSLGTLVIEAPKKSGSLITARLATEMGKEVYVLPGRAGDRNAEGGNHLIAHGQAKLVQGLEDILEELGPVTEALRSADHEGGHETPLRDSLGQALDLRMLEGADSEHRHELILEDSILENLGEAPIHIDELCARFDCPVQEVAAALILLELKRKVQKHPGKFYSRLQLNRV